MNLQLDITNDLVFVNNNLTVIFGADEIRQRVRNRLLAFQGEWFLDVTLGVPYFQQILVKNPNIGNVDAYIKAEIINTPGVNKLLSYSSTYDPRSRTYTATFTVQTAAGIFQDILPAVLPSELSPAYTLRFASVDDMLAYTGKPGDTAIVMTNPNQRWRWDTLTSTWTPTL